MNSIKFFMLACLVCFATASATAQNPRAQKKIAAKSAVLGPDQLLSLGDYYTNSNDVSNAADTYYQRATVIAPGSQAAGRAQYSRGGYWFRKFYVVREQYSKDDYSALTEAEGQYFDFIDKFARGTNTVDLLSDAEFYLALVYLQQGKREYAIGWLNRMLNEAVRQDGAVYVYKVVWSSKPGDIVDRNVDAAQLALFTRQAIQRSNNLESVLLDIRRWCQKQ